jgi:hypothetical protein
MYKRTGSQAALRIIALILSTGLASAENSRCEVESPTGDVWITPERCIDLRRGAVAPYKSDVQSLSRKVSPRPDTGAPETTIITPSQQESHQTDSLPVIFPDGIIRRSMLGRGECRPTIFRADYAPSCASLD